MIFFKSKVHPIVKEKALEAEVLKASMISEDKSAIQDVRRLNKLIKSNGFTLKIVVGMGKK